jgi:hypothetical protein
MQWGCMHRACMVTSLTDVRSDLAIHHAAGEEKLRAEGE